MKWPGLTNNPVPQGDSAVRDEFLSEEDLDLRALSEQELIAYWNLWLEQAQATNEVDRPSYSHGVFETEPPP